MRRKPKQAQRRAALTSAADVLADLFSTPVKFEDREISAREAYIRALYNESLSEKVDSAIELQQLREACGFKDEAEPGCLVVPSMTDEEWERLAYEQQAPFREKNYGKVDSWSLDSLTSSRSAD
jgi:hypothetical protein